METPRIRRPRLTYANVTATFALLIATSMGGAYAHGMIGSSEIQNNAVKTRHIGAGQVKAADLGAGAVRTAKIRNGAVTVGKLAPSARTRVTKYSLGSHDFASNPALDIDLPGNLSRTAIENSVWEIQLIFDFGPDSWYFPMPGPGIGGTSTYRAGVEHDGTVWVYRTSGAGETYRVRVFRTSTNASINVAPRHTAPSGRNSG